MEQDPTREHGHGSLAASDEGPTFPWLAAGFLLAGLGTALLGPILPSLQRNWSLSDTEGGRLLLAKFLGAFVGGISVPRQLRWGIFTGTLLGGLGFGLFALCHSLLPAAACLFVSGIGLGQIIASTNILAGRRFRVHTGAALAMLNFFWSLGAVLTGVLAGALLPHAGLRNPLLTFACLFLATGAGGLFARSHVPVSSPPASGAAALGTLASRPLAYFSLLLLLYGGLETCLTAWLTTYVLRVSDIHLFGGQSAVVLLWAALTGGRVLASAALRVLSEAIVQRISLVCTFTCILGLIASQRSFSLSLWSILLGVSLAPYFPSTFALLMPFQPPARAAGFILAVSGLGAALFPWLMGVLSSASGSLRAAMSIPLALAGVLLFLTVISPAKSTEADPNPAALGAKIRRRLRYN